MSDLILPRRAFLTGLGALFAAPAIVRAASLMPVRPWDDGMAPYTSYFRWSVPQAKWRELYFIGDMPSVFDGPIDLFARLDRAIQGKVRPL